MLHTSKLKGAGLFVCFFVTVLFIFAVSLAKADDETAAQSETLQNEGKNGHTLDPCVVTAQKREESLQDVPISIMSFTGQQLDDAGINNTQDLVKQVPNVTLKYAEPENTLIIRGVTSFHSSLYAPAGYYVDDVSYPLQYMQNAELFDVERVEVLKGPQGTLYGRNTESGVIKVVTKQPGNETTGKVLAEYGHYNTYRVTGNLSTPLVEDKLFMGLAFQSHLSDGYYTNVYDDDNRISKKDHLTGRASLRWKPTGKWDVTLGGDFLDNNDGYGLYRFLDGPNQTDRHEVNVDYPDNYMRERGNGQTLKVSHQFDFFDFLSVTGNRAYKRELVGDRDGTASPAQYSNFEWKDDQISQEFRFTSNDSTDSFQWLFGLYGFKEKVDTRNHVIHLVMGDIWDNKTDIDVTGYAAFSQIEYSFWDGFKATAGLRADHHDLDGKLIGAPSFLTPAGQTLSSKMKHDELLPKFALSYDVSDDIMCYGTIAKGYLIGGFNYVSAYSQQGFTYDPEYTWNYEVGVKSSWFGNRLSLNLAAFYIDIVDKQVFEIDQTVPVSGAQTIKNAARAHSVGFEVEAQARPINGLDIVAGFGLTEAKIDDWVATEAGGVQYDYKGKHLTYYPSVSSNVGIQYTFLSGWFARTDFLYTGKTYCDSKNLIKQDPHTEVNLRMGYKGENLGVTLWADNVFDEKYYEYMTNFGANKLVVDGAPMTFGANISYSF